MLFGLSSLHSASGANHHRIKSAIVHFPRGPRWRRKHRRKRAAIKRGFITMAKKFATTSMSGNAHSQGAIEHMCVATAEGQTHSLPAQHAIPLSIMHPQPKPLHPTTSTHPTSPMPSTNIHPSRQLKPEAFRRGLEPHEDREFVERLIYQCTNGVPIGYEGPRCFRLHDNWPSSIMQFSP